MQPQEKFKTSEIYIHQSPPSFKSQFLQTLMGIVGKRKTLERSFRKKSFASQTAKIPKALQERCTKTSEVNHRKAWTFKPSQTSSKKTILYLHGGGYVSNLSHYDWDFVEVLLVKTKATIVVADYPLAPSCTYKDAYFYLEKLYLEILAETDSQNIVFMGNSAGGGLALGFAQKLRDECKPQPSQIILNAPWLDISLNNPDIKELENADKMLGLEGLKMAGKEYAAELPTKDYKVSPIYGKFDGVAKISLFIGTHDLFLADARSLKKKLNEQNISINYFEYPKMFHLWMAVTSLKESQHVIDQMEKLVNSEN